MNIKGMDKARILKALYNRSQPIGMGMLHFTPTPMTTEDAQKIIDEGSLYFDYLKGRVMKFSLAGDDMRTDLYNRDNGNGAAERAIAEEFKQD
ncbi:MAG: hypothetical protein V1755_14085 [Chloroflexota bacterium]